MSTAMRAPEPGESPGDATTWWPRRSTGSSWCCSWRSIATDLGRCPTLLPKTAEDEPRRLARLGWVARSCSSMVLRLAWRLTHKPPPPPSGPRPRRYSLLSRVTHWLFYVVLIALPLLGWAAASAFGVTRCACSA